MLRLRKFRPNDLDQVMEIVNHSLNDEYSPEFYLNLHSIWPEGFLVAQSWGRVVGFVMGVISGPGQARVLVLAVRPLSRKRGVGRALLETFTANAREIGATNITLEVRVTNAGGIKFYAALGYRITRTIPHYYKNGEDGYVMERNI